MRELDGIHTHTHTHIHSHTHTHTFTHIHTGPVAEDLLWEYVIQLVSALRVVHGAGLALRCIDSTKVLLTGRQR